ICNSHALCFSQDHGLISFGSEDTSRFAQLSTQRNGLLNERSLLCRLTWRSKCELLQEVTCDRIGEQSGLSSPTFRSTYGCLGLCQGWIALERHSFQIFQSHNWTGGDYLTPRSLNVCRLLNR